MSWLNRPPLIAGFLVIEFSHNRLGSFVPVLMIVEHGIIQAESTGSDSMTGIPLKLSVLDQSPAAAGESASVALRHTIELARMAEQWGYHRFWVAEHHGSNRNMGSSPEVLISHLLARTERIRLGSGGVMLQHYSPYKVAENFNVLASLAPGRVDLGIGRGPGGMPRSTRALRPQPTDRNGSATLEEKLVELRQFLHDRHDDTSPHKGLTATPLPPTPADLFLLGATADSAELAARQQLPYIFAMFLNGDEAEMERAMDTYRSLCAQSPDFLPQPMLALPVIVADTEDEAAGYAAAIRIVRITLAGGARLHRIFGRSSAGIRKSVRRGIHLRNPAGQRYPRNARDREAKVAGDVAEVWG